MQSVQASTRSGSSEHLSSPVTDLAQTAPVAEVVHVASAASDVITQPVVSGVSGEPESLTPAAAQDSETAAVHVDATINVVEVNIATDETNGTPEFSQTTEHVETIVAPETEQTAVQVAGSEVTVISFDAPLDQDNHEVAAASTSELDITAESAGETAAIEAIESVVDQVDADLEDIPPPPSAPAPSLPKHATPADATKKSGGLFGFLGSKKKHKAEPATPASPTASQHDGTAHPHVEPVPPPKVLGIRARDMRMTDAQRIEIMTLVKGKQLTVDEAVERVLATEKSLAEV